jgi:branched-chain amino acid transport system substrate-binding protein
LRTTWPTESKSKLVAIIDDATAYGEGLADEVEKTLKAASDQGPAARKGRRQESRLEGDPHQTQGASKPDAVFYGGMDATGGPLLEAGA